MHMDTKYMMKIAFLMHNENVKYLANCLKVTGSPHWGRIKQAHLTPDIKINPRCSGIAKDDVVVTGVAL